MSFVLDPSAAASLFLDDEVPHPRLIERFADRQVAVVPELFLLEMLNVLVTAVRRGRADAAKLQTLLGYLARLNVEVKRAGDEPGAILNLALRHSLTSYDARYLAQAIALGIPLATQDRRLARAATAEGVELALAD